MRKSSFNLIKLVVVESPNKVIKIEGLLSDPKIIPDWSFNNAALRKISKGPEKAIAMATTGHFMSLKEINWSPYAANSELTQTNLPSNNNNNNLLASFGLEWELLPGRRIQETLSRYLNETKDITEIIIATDPDREGELIATHFLHLSQRLFPRISIPYSRAYIHSITEEGIVKAMMNRTNKFDYYLSFAAEARHAMDRIFGFLGSSVVRYANPQMRSIGRVQTPALILIKEREDKIQHFLNNMAKTYYIGAMCEFMDTKGKYYSQPVTLVPLQPGASFDWSDESGVQRMAARWNINNNNNNNKFSIVAPPTVQKQYLFPPQPFTMATFITKANRQLKISSEQVSSCLQDLFQMGFITYPRTDSCRIEEKARLSIYKAITQLYGKSFVYRLEDRPSEKSSSSSLNNNKRRNKEMDESAQGNVEDAHEAIRPTNIFLEASSLGALPEITKSVYELIRKNTLASFMIPLQSEKITIRLSFPSGSGEIISFSLEGKKITQPGWTRAFPSDDTENNNSNNNNNNSNNNNNANKTSIHSILPVRSISSEEFDALLHLPSLFHTPKKNIIQINSLKINEHRPSPPLLHTEGSLIEELKNNNVGRPSTYPLIVKTLLAREYIYLNKGRCQTTDIGRLLVETSRVTFPSIVDIGFTADFERKLDRIAKPNAVENKSNEINLMIAGKRVSDVDHVLSSFVSTFLNYVTEATKQQRAIIAEKSFLLKEEKGNSSEAPYSGENKNNKSNRKAIESEKKKAMAQVPDLLSICKKYPNFSGVQKALNDYLRAYFPSVSKPKKSTSPKRKR